MECLATSFTGLTGCRPAIEGVTRLYVALWYDGFASNLDYQGDIVSGETKKLAWKELPTTTVTQVDNTLLTEGKFKDTIAFETAGFYIADRSTKSWINYNRLVFVFVGANGNAFISGEENGHKSVNFKDSTSGSASNWTFEANTTYSNYGISSEYLEKIQETSSCGDYTDLLALGNTTTIQEQAECIVGDYTGFIP